jgi:hypothetical protein
MFTPVSQMIKNLAKKRQRKTTEQRKETILLCCFIDYRNQSSMGVEKVNRCVATSDDMMVRKISKTDREKKNGLPSNIEHSVKREVVIVLTSHSQISVLDRS